MSTENQSTTEAGNGSRLRCNTCHCEAIVTSASGSALTCCGEPLEVIFNKSG